MAQNGISMIVPPSGAIIMMVDRYWIGGGSGNGLEGGRVGEDAIVLWYSFLPLGYRWGVDASGWGVPV